MLYVMVGGPGVGEAVAVALPNSGWVVVDGCEVRGVSVPAAIVTAFRRQPSDPVRMMVLSHPHDDHAGGFADAVDELDPERILLTASRPPGPHLLQTARAWLRDLEASHTADELRRRSVVAALKAIERWESSHPGAILCGLEGTSFSWPSGGVDVTCTVRAPRQCKHLDAVFEALAAGDRAAANDASLVIEIQYGDTRVVLGGDLPWLGGPGRTPVATGWQSTMSAHPALADHTALKVPHHGSAEALHPNLIAPGAAVPRPWFVSPFAAQRLPRLDEPGGLPRIMIANAALDLSSPVPAWIVPNSVSPATVSISALKPRRSEQPTGDAFADGADDVRPDPPVSATAPVCCYAFDRGGMLRGCWFGESALRVTA
ncbi:MAG TPA: hypothetical protein PLI95_03410 [Polyangiaceae bacterium]|nr:hypothetical protein [Polyangiaceae bacterium]